MFNNNQILLLLVGLCVLCLVVTNCFDSVANKTQENMSVGKAKIINFNTSWCGYSRQFEPVWAKFALKMKGRNIEVINMKCDQDENKGTCNKYSIRGYPTVKLILGDGKEIEFNGNRTVDALEAFCNKYI